MKFKQWGNVFKCAFKGFGEDKVSRLSAALAYYSIFSLGPLLVIVVGLAGLIFGEEGVRRQVTEALQGVLGEKATGAVQSMMSMPKQGSLITTILGIVGLLLGASGVFGELQEALNTIWKVKAKPGGGIWKLLRDRFLSLTMVLGIGFLLLISMVLTTALTALTGAMGNRLPISEGLMHVLNFVVSFGVITLLFAMIFKVLPDVKVKWGDVWTGALGTAFLFTIGKYLLSWYLGRASTTSSYGAAGSIVLILLWVYYASLILFFGAEFTRAYAIETGSQIVPSDYAVPVTEQERAEEGMEPATGRQKPEPRKGRAPTPAPAPAAGFRTAEGSQRTEQASRKRVPSHEETERTRIGKPEMTAPAPGEVLRHGRWQFITLGAAAALVSGVVMKLSGVRGLKAILKLSSRHA